MAKTRKPSQYDFDRLYKSKRNALRKVTLAYKENRISFIEWRTQFLAILTDAHKKAARLGRLRGGNSVDNDELLALQAIARELPWFNRFADAVNRVSLNRALYRTSLYASRLLGTANTSLHLQLTQRGKVYWVLGAVEHCSVCPRRAAASPYNIGELQYVPGDLSTPCLANCKCWLEYVFENNKRLKGFRYPA